MANPSDCARAESHPHSAFTPALRQSLLVAHSTCKNFRRCPCKLDPAACWALSFDHLAWQAILMNFQGHRPFRSLSSLFRMAALLGLATLASAIPALAQRPGAPGVVQPGQTGGSLNSSFTNLLVSVRDSTGGPMSVNALVRIFSNFNNIRMTAPVQDGGAASFSNIPAGDYEVVAEAPGYVAATEHADILLGSTSFTVYVYMHPEGEVSPSDPRARPLMTPKLQSEVDKALEKMRKQQFDPALAHMSKAEKMAPGNPDIQYLTGMVEYQQGHMDLAQARFEKALSIFPTHERALVLLGELQLRAGQPEKAIQSLEKAFQVNGADWRAQYLLGSAYLSQKDSAKALTYAQHALELSKGRYPSVQLLLGRALLQQNQRDQARAQFTAVVKNYPKDPAAKDAQGMLERMDNPTLVAMAVAPGAGSAAQPVSASSTTLEDTLPAAPAALPVPAFVRPWSPPDIDAREYVLASDVSCSEDQVVQRTQTRTLKQLESFEKFSATEHIEHREIDAYGNAGAPREKNFTYLVFVQRPRPEWLFLDEQRDGGDSLADFPTNLATRGLVGLGVFFFSPEYQSDFTYKCEGLSQWRGQAVWQIRLEQKREIPSRVMTWRNRRGVYPVPLKARVWVSANTYDVVHLETDLRDPVPDVELAREHLVIDYGPVNFEHANTSLWLPWHADMYLEVHNKRYHHRHTLTNYALFSVDTNHQISAPKNLPKDDSQDPPQQP
jgi:tetratricopeptide (TPR) repeat protein